jgi:tetratricopeptide (TPR) repeat protein
MVNKPVFLFSRARLSLGVIGGFFFLGVLTYFPSLNASFLWDDHDFITQNQYVKEARIDKFFTAQPLEGAGKVSNYYRPVQFTFYAIIYRIFGPNPLAFHALSISIHILASIALYYFLTRLTVSHSHRLTLSPSQRLTCLAVSLLFLIHPVQTEAVSYVSGLSDPLVALFGFTTIYLFLKQKYTLSMFFFILTLLSKESGVIFLGILLLLTVSPSHRLTLSPSQRLTIFFPYAILTLLYLLYHKTIEVIDMATVFGNSPYTNSVFVRLATFLSILPQYIGILLFPKDLFYDRDFSVNILTTPWHLPSFIALFILITVFMIIHKNRLSLFAFFCFLFSLLPFCGLVLINGIMYEHFLYLAVPFFFLYLFESFKTYTSSKTFFVLFTVFCFLFIARSWMRQMDWQDPIRFYKQTLTHVPNSFRVLNNLGLEYLKLGEYDLAIQTFEKALSYNPSLPNPFHNIGTIYMKQKNYKKAEEYFYKALQKDPDFGYSYASLVELYQQTNNMEKVKEISGEIMKRFKQ